MNDSFLRITAQIFANRHNFREEHEAVNETTSREERVPAEYAVDRFR